MADLATNAFTTYSANVNREDLADIIKLIDPVETWFQSTIGDTKATGRYHEWSIDLLPAAAANAHAEGETVTAAAVCAATRTGNYCQTLQRAFIMTETQDTVLQAANADQTARQKMKQMKAMANDLEFAAVLTTAAPASASAGSARTMKGLLGWVTTNVTTAGTAVTASGINEADFVATLALIWAEGGRPSNVLVGATQKRSISNFTGNGTKFVLASDKAVNQSVTVYNSDFGDIKIRLHYMMNSITSLAVRSVMILGQMDYWRLAWLRKPQWKKLPLAAFAEFWGIESELTLESLNQKSAGKCTGYSSATVYKG